MKELIDELSYDLAECHVDYLDDAKLYTDYDTMAQKLISRGYRRRSEWISVKDRLPERGQAVLCYRGDFRGDMMNTYVYLGSGNWEDDYGYRGTAEHEGITHWMPLPKAPKGGAE